MKYPSIILIACAALFGLKASAQQDPHFSLYRYNMNIINPAYAGSNDYFEATGAIRSQWSGVPGGPETQSFNFNTPLGGNVGVGLSVVNDKVFVLGQTDLYADFSYRLQLSESVDLYAGVKAGGTFVNIDLNEAGVMNDPLFTENVSQFNPNVGLGFYLKGEKYYVTVSAPGVLSNERFEKEGTVPVEANDDLNIFVGGGYDLSLSDDFQLRPSVLGKVVNGAPLSIDLTGSVRYREQFELGTNYRWDESFTFFAMFGVLDNALSFGYAYEYATTSIGNFNNGSHEVLLKFRL